MPFKRLFILYKDFIIQCRKNQYDCHFQMCSPTKGGPALKPKQPAAQAYPEKQSEQEQRRSKNSHLCVHIGEHSSCCCVDQIGSDVCLHGGVHWSGGVIQRARALNRLV
jgi:hypothetical protein